ncbi:MAG: preprotein translocase subunit SecG [Sandaracinobacter sp.]
MQAGHYVAGFLHTVLARQIPVLMNFLLVVHGLIALALVGVILIQKSEGGGLTSGGNASGLVSARGAADLLTRSTAILATLFIVSSLGLAWLAGHSNRPKTIDTTLAREAPAVGPLGAPTAPAPGAVPAAPAPADAPPIAN